MKRLFLILAILLILIPAAYPQETYTVKRVIDGDTLDTSLGRVRIFGADAPERLEVCSKEATNAMRYLAGAQVRLERGPRTTDEFGRELFYVYTDS